MKITLEEPFASVWKSGYLRKSKQDGRSRVDLFNSNADRTTISYARYLLSIKLGRFLAENEEADHINKDNTDDSLDNIQLLTVEEHRAKTGNERRGRAFVTLICPQCLQEFQKEARFIKPDTIPKCSRRCNALYTRSQGKWGGRTK